MCVWGGVDNLNLGNQTAAEVWGWGAGRGDGSRGGKRPSWGHAAKLRPENNEQSSGSRKVV